MRSALRLRPAVLYLAVGTLLWTGCSDPIT